MRGLATRPSELATELDPFVNDCESIATIGMAVVLNISPLSSGSPRGSQGVPFSFADPIPRVCGTVPQPRPRPFYDCERNEGVELREWGYTICMVHVVDLRKPLQCVQHDILY